MPLEQNDFSGSTPKEKHKLDAVEIQVLDKAGSAFFSLKPEDKQIVIPSTTEVVDENGDSILGGGGGGLSGSISSGQVAFGTGTDTIGGDAGFTFDPTGVLGSDSAALNLILTGSATLVTGAAVEHLGNSASGSSYAIEARAGTASGMDNVGDAEAIILNILHTSSGTLGVGVGIAVNAPIITNGGDITEYHHILLDDLVGRADTQAALTVGNVTGGMVNYAIKTGAGDIVFGGITEHADNAAAVLAGLAVGSLYRTGDALKIVHA